MSRGTGAVPDGDVYDRNVERGWRPAARFVHSGELGFAIPRLVRCLGQSLREHGYPGLLEILAIAVPDTGFAQDGIDRREVTAKLESVRRTCPSDRTTLGVNVVRRLMTDPIAKTKLLGLGSDVMLARELVASEIFANLAMIKVSSAAVSRKLIAVDGMTNETVQFRRRRAHDELVSAPEMHKLARRVITNPEGQTFRAPRVKMPRLAQAEILDMAIGA